MKIAMCKKISTWKLLILNMVIVDSDRRLVVLWETTCVAKSHGLFCAIMEEVRVLGNNMSSRKSCFIERVWLYTP